MYKRVKTWKIWYWSPSKVLSFVINQKANKS